MARLLLILLICPLLIAARSSNLPRLPLVAEAPASEPSVQTTQGEQQPEQSQPEAPPQAGSAEVIFSPTPEADQKPDEQIIYPAPVSAHEKQQIVEADQGYRINFRDVPILSYIQWVSEISGTNFIYNEKDLLFKVTIVSEEPTSIDNIMAAMLQVLRIHGLSMAEQANNVIIFKDADLAKIAEVISTDSSQDAPQTPPIITRVFKIYNVTPSGLASIIQPLLSAQAVVEVSTETGHIVVTDIRANVEKVDQLIEALDNPKTPIEIAVYRARYGNVTMLVALTQEIMAPFLEGQPFTLVPQATADAIYIISTPYLIEQAVATLRTLDTPEATKEIEAEVKEAQAEPEKLPPSESHEPQDGGPQELPPSRYNTLGTYFEIYKLQYHDGSDMVLALREIAASMIEGGMTDGDLIQAIRSIQWIQSNNSLVITGNEMAIGQVTELLQQLDVPLKQVLIEMLILKTDITNALAFGVEWAAVGQAGAAFSGAVASTPASPDSSPSVAGVRPNFPAGQLPLVPGLALDAIGSVIKKDSTHFLSIQTLINAIESDTNTEVVTNQKLLVQDSKTAAVFVGQQIAFSEGTIAFGEGTNFATTSFDYRDIGTSMQITPFIGNGKIITLEISQEVSEATNFNTSSDDSGNQTQIPTTDRTTTTTRVHVPDRHFLIISGQIRGENSTIKSGLPCLGGLPIIGGVFSSTQDEVAKNNLIIFIRPQVVASIVQMLEMDRSQIEQFEMWNSPHPLELDMREWLNLPKTCWPVNEPCPCEVPVKCCPPRTCPP